MQRLKEVMKHFDSSKENKKTFVKKFTFYKPTIVCVTGAAGNIAYSVLFGIGRGKLLGSNHLIKLRLLDIPQMISKVRGVIMELRDCAFPLIVDILATDSYQKAFENCEVALLVGAKPRGKGMLRSDLLKQNAKIFKGQGKAINRWADKNIKVVVVGNPANTNALITMKNAPSIPRENFTALTRLDQNRAVSQIAEKMNTNVENIKNVVIWGNHSKTQYPDTRNAFLDNIPFKGQISTVRSQISNDWLDKEFIKIIQERGAAIIKTRGASSAASAANATLDHIRSWLLGTATGEWVSMGVCSDNNDYNIPKNLIFSFPCICSNGNWKIVSGINLDNFSREKIRISAEELINERNAASLI